MTCLLNVRVVVSVVHRWPTIHQRDKTKHDKYLKNPLSIPSAGLTTALSCTFTQTKGRFSGNGCLKRVLQVYDGVDVHGALRERDAVICGKSLFACRSSICPHRKKRHHTSAVKHFWALYYKQINSLIGQIISFFKTAAVMHYSERKLC